MSETTLNPTSTPEQPKQSPSTETPQKKEGRLSRIAKLIKNRVNGPKPDPHGALEDMAAELTTNKTIESTETSPRTAEEKQDRTEKTESTGTEPIIDKIETRDENDTETTETLGEKPAWDLDRYKRLLGGEGTREDLMELQEMKTLRSEEMQPIWKIDGIVRSIEDLNNGTSFNSVYDKQQVKESLDWLVENPKRISLAIEYMQAQEAVLDKYAALPGLTASEKEHIDALNSLLGKVRNELKERGIAVESRQQSPEIITPENISGGGIPIDPETADDYAYHATPLVNTPSIAEKGLIPSPLWSKEPGTIFYNSFAGSKGYTSIYTMRFRTHGLNIPEVAEEGRNEDGKLAIGVPGATATPIPPNLLEYSFDGGKTWRHDLTPFQGIISRNFYG